MTITRSMLNAITGFEEGDTFTSPEEVWDYFSVETQTEMFGSAGAKDQSYLDRCAAVVINYGWNCEF